MPSRINVVIALTPINEIPALANEYVAHEMVDAQVGGSIANATSIRLPSGAMVRVGSLDGYVYSSANRYAGVGEDYLSFSPMQNPQVLYVRHTGKIHSTTSAPLSVAAVNAIAVTIASSLIGYLMPGEALLLPLHSEFYSNEHGGGLNSTLIAIHSLGSEQVAVEALLLG